jgi:crotonobetainyl-CoA:carnitine CoA-transferase CaiB-like acyl-CoA transferase
MGPLQGIRVLDLTRILAGPSATQVLADLGAEVIKVERPGTGDDTRQWAPPFVQDRAGRDTGETAYYACANRGKKSIAVDLAHPEGQGVVRRLAECSDVLLENFKVGTLAQYGLDYASLKAVNSRLVYGSITGYGQTGPYAARAGYDPVAQAMGGLMSVTGVADGEPGGGPLRVGVAMTDVMTGLQAVVGVLSALIHRQVSGVGQYLDIALLDVQLASMANVAQAYLSAGIVGRRHGTGHPSVVPSQAFHCREGGIMLVAGNDSQFRALCRVVGRPEWADDPRFADNASRRRHREALLGALADIFLQDTAQAWTDRCSAAGIPCGPINDMAQAFADPHVKARGMRIELDHPTAGTLSMVANPLRFSETRVEYRLPPPLLGEHTTQVLSETLGLGPAEIARLREVRAVA